MASFTKSARCLNCSKENTFSLSTELALTELQIQAKCSGCANSVQITFALVGGETKPESTTSLTMNTTSSSASEERDLPNKAIEELING